MIDRIIARIQDVETNTGHKPNQLLISQEEWSELRRELRGINLVPDDGFELGDALAEIDGVPIYLAALAE